ncbi:MAG: hypothetical protein M5U13_05065 [Thermoanaerobaculia bacterium]|nr:hypothetical protein [Thermoanaerobaculia bacterium]
MRLPALALAALLPCAAAFAVAPEGAAASLTSALPEAAGPAIPAAAQCAGGLQHDDGTVENGYSFNSGFGIGDLAHWAERYDPGTGPYRFSQVCVCLTGLGATANAPIDIVFFADGAGQPGAEIARIPATASGIPTYPSTAFFDVPVQVDTNGPVWVAVNWNVDASPQVFVCADQNGAGSPVPGMTTTDGGAVWEPLTDYWPDARALFLRAEAAPSVSVLEVPTLGIAGLAALALGLGALAFFLLRRRTA